MVAIDQRQLRPDNCFKPDFLCRLVKPHDAIQTVVIGERQGLVAQLGRPVYERLGMLGAIEKRKIRMAVQFGIRGHD